MLPTYPSYFFLLDLITRYFVVKITNYDDACYAIFSSLLSLPSPYVQVFLSDVVRSRMQTLFRK
jgi:hypothetical protein